MLNVAFQAIPRMLRVRRLVFYLPLISLANVAVASEPVDVRETIQKGLAFLAEEAMDWKPARKCASCHQVPMGIWSLNEGKTWGYPVDEKEVMGSERQVVARAAAGQDFSCARLQARHGKEKRGQ